MVTVVNLADGFELLVGSILFLKQGLIKVSWVLVQKSRLSTLNPKTLKKFSGAWMGKGTLS